MRIPALFVLVTVAAAACGDATAVSQPNPPPPASSIDIEGWCGSVSANRCVEGVVHLEWNPGHEGCVFAAEDESISLWDECEPTMSSSTPETTVPTEDTEAAREAAEVAHREAMTRRTPALDATLTELLARTHPDDVVTGGLVFDQPLTVAEIEQLAADTSTTLSVAWRADYVCLPGSPGVPFSQASRSARFDGVEEAARLRAEMDNSTTPVTGGHIARNIFDVMEQEAIALRAPGVLLEAVQAEIPVSVLAELGEDARIERVRLADFPTDWLDLSNAPVPECVGA